MLSSICSSRLLKNSQRSFRDGAISAFTRVFDAPWRRARNPETQEMPASGFRVRAIQVGYSRLGHFKTDLG